MRRCGNSASKTSGSTRHQRTTSRLTHPRRSLPATRKTSAGPRRGSSLQFRYATPHPRSSRTRHLTGWPLYAITCQRPARTFPPKGDRAKHFTSRPRRRVAWQPPRRRRRRTSPPSTARIRRAGFSSGNPVLLRIGVRRHGSKLIALLRKP